jgi:hypothetical protein
MWKVIGASVTGNSHEAAGIGCEDASSWEVGPEVTCLAVADGAGSRPLSGHGASLAVKRALLMARAVANRAEPDDPQMWLQLIVKDVRHEIATLAKAEEREPGDFAATLGVVILTSAVACIGQIGDTIAVLGGPGGYRTIDPAPRSEYVNETSFVTDDTAMEQLRVTITPIGEVDSAFLSTDGLRFKVLGNLVTADPFPPFFEDLAAYAQSADASADEIRRFLADLDDQSGDDKTIVAAVRAEPEPESSPEAAGVPVSSSDGAA